jgi:hypothetical protein
LTTQEQIAAFIAANPAPQVEDGPRGIVPAARDQDDDRDADGKRKIHGSAGFSVGSGGYRSAYASALMPVGENTTVGVAVSKTDYGKRGAYLDPYYGYGGGYGYGGPWQRGGESQSLALSVMTGSDGVMATCRPAARLDLDGSAMSSRSGCRTCAPMVAALPGQRTVALIRIPAIDDRAAFADV